MKNILSYKDSIDLYNNTFKKSEKKTLIKEILQSSDEEIIIRLDGKNLSKKFSDENNIFSDCFYSAMVNILKSIIKEFPFIKIAYTFKDEISLLLDMKKLDESDDYKRYEKLVSLISGYVSACFTRYVNSNSNDKAFYYFDARIVTISSSLKKNYFIYRRNLAIRAFIDKVESHHCLSHNNIFNHKQLIEFLDKYNYNFDDYKKYMYGYIGYKNNNKWTIEIAEKIDAIL